MSRLLMIAALLGLMLGTSVQADVAPEGPPRPRPKNVESRLLEITPTVIEMGDESTLPVLQIPRSLLEKLGLQKKADAGLELKTVVAGLAMTGAFMSAGLFIARRKRMSVAPMVAFFGLSLGAGIVLADKAVGPARADEIVPRAQDEEVIPYPSAKTGVEVYVLRDDQPIKLLLSKQTITELLADAEKLEAEKKK